MPLGTLDPTPPPFFRQGPSALTRLLFFASLAIFLMAADTRFSMIGPLRTAAAVLLHPIERAWLAPVNGFNLLRDYLGGISRARQVAEVAQIELTRQSERSLLYEQLLAENASLRSLLLLRERLQIRATAAEVLYAAADPYSRKVVVDRGGQHGVERGAPVINEQGVLGQVTRVYPQTAEVTLLTDRDASIPVLNARTQQRSVAFGDPETAGLELRFMAANADIQVQDELQTSGLDGVYPPGLPVARVQRLQRRTQSDFARIELTPAARIDGVRHVLVLSQMAGQLPTRPDLPDTPASAPTSRRAASSPAAAASTDRPMPRLGGPR